LRGETVVAEHSRGILFHHLEISYTDMFTLWKIIKLCIYHFCTFQNMWCVDVCLHTYKIYQKFKQEQS
jgi:hypothetical protein